MTQPCELIIMGKTYHTRHLYAKQILRERIFEKRYCFLSHFALVTPSLYQTMGKVCGLPIYWLQTGTSSFWQTFFNGQQHVPSSG